MAKKKQRKKVYKPPAPKLETQFNCPECGRKKVVEVRFMKKENKGYLRCRACGEEYQGKLKRASTPIDIYYEWIDHRDQEKEEEYKKKTNEEEGEEEKEEYDEQGEQQENGYDNDNDDNENYENEDQSQNKGDEDYNEEEGSDYE